MPLPQYSEKDDRPLSGVRHVVAIAAGKGGVGKSTVTVNLARQIRRRGLSVGILDADVYGPSIPKMLPMDKAPGKQGNLLVPAESEGIKLMSMAYFRRDGEAAAVRAPVANGIITQFIAQIAWGNLDYLLVDFPPGTGDVQLTLAQKIAFSGALMVTTPQEIAVMDVRKAIDLFRQVHVPVYGVVENMSYLALENGTVIYPFGSGGGETIAALDKTTLLAKLPVDAAISECCDRGQPLPASSPSFAVYQQLAEAVISASESAETVPRIAAIEEGMVVRIDWQDGRVQKVPAEELQKHCPCAGCRTGARVNAGRPAVLSTTPVGRYAVRFSFSAGCSAGIFDYTMLHALGGFE